MEDEIKGEGPENAQIMVVGDWPDEAAVKEGRPFAGMAGRVLDGLIRDSGMVREQIYFTNIFTRREHGIDESLPVDGLILATRRINSSINRINPRVVICLGEHATKLITGRTGISHWRGSILHNTDGRKCIPSYHPSSIAKEWTFRQTALVDFQRALRESSFPEIRRQERIYEIARTIEETRRLLGTFYGGSQRQGCSDIRYSTSIREECLNVAFDIETESGQITSIAFAPDNRPDWAVCIPFWFGSSGSLWSAEEEVEIWGLIKALLTDERIGKIAHNGSYDIEFIQRTLGFRVTPFAFDTMLGVHTLYLELPKALAYAVSIYTDHPYYKGDIHSKDMDTYFRYNATDACLTMEIATKLMAELKEEGLWEFYKEYVHSLWEPLMEMSLKGVKFDYLRKNSIKKRMQEEVATLQRNLDAAVGHAINTNSPKQMKEWLYQELKYKPKTKRKKGSVEETITADEEALEDLYRETKDENLKTVLKIRERQKVISTYLEVTLDEDKRIRCNYSITGTETGRLSSSKTARGTGTNLQNVPPGPVRSLFIPDPGKVFINADLSQAEARVVAYISNESRLIRVFEEGGDIHRKNASNIFRVSESEVTDEQRQMAKRVVHASNYGMGPITFAKQCDIPASEAKRLLNQYFATYPEIANWQLSIASQLRSRRYLTTPFGRKRYFFNRYNEGLVKEGLAFIPQSTVADIVGKALVCAHRKGIELLLQVHDSLLVQTSAERVQETCEILKECLSTPIEINGKVLVIPTDVKVGMNWEDMKKPPAI